MSHLNWSKTKKRNNTPKHLNQENIKKNIRQSWKAIEEKHGPTYKDKTFFIDRKPIEKYKPQYYQDRAGTTIRHSPGMTGIYFNTDGGTFDALKDGQVISSIPWKAGQLRLIEWRKKFL